MNVTGIVPTVARPAQLAWLLSSWAKHQPDMPLIVIDQSDEQYATSMVEAVLETDQRLGCLVVEQEEKNACRAYHTGLSLTCTPWYAFLEDDFVMRSETDYQMLVDLAVQERYDILGGGLYNAASQHLQSRCIHFTRNDRSLHTEAMCPPESPFIMPCDYITNHYVGRTIAVKKAGGWDPEQRLVAHLDFYLRMSRGGVRVAGSRMSPVDHDRRGSDEEYSKLRFGDMPAWRLRLLNKWNLDAVTGHEAFDREHQ